MFFWYCGEMVRPALDAVALLKEEGISAGLLDMYCVKPLDREGLVKAAEKAKVVISIEEHAPFGAWLYGQPGCRCRVPA